jgi:hypothetical protein
MVLMVQVNFYSNKTNLYFLLFFVFIFLFLSFAYLPFSSLNIYALDYFNWCGLDIFGDCYFSRLFTEVFLR